MRTPGFTWPRWGVRAAFFAAGMQIVAGRPYLTECPADGPAASYRWVNDGEQLYVEDGGCVTLPDIYRDVEDSPLVPVTADGEESAEETG